MGLRKGWEQRKIHENLMSGWYFDRWYLKSPSGNFYRLGRSDTSRQGLTHRTISLIQDMQKLYEVYGLSTKPVTNYIEPRKLGEYTTYTARNGKSYDVWERWDWNRVLQEIYKIEESGTYSKQLSDDIENFPECKNLFASPKKSQRVMTY